jgi:repressor LexA
MFVLRVQGESMIDEGIRDGDYIVCESTRTALSGQTVVAVIDGEKATVKNYYPERGRIRLQPANEKHEAIFITDDRLDIQGIVVGLWRPPQ